MAKKTSKTTLTPIEKSVIKALLNKGWRSQDILALINTARPASINFGRIAGIKADGAILPATDQQLDAFRQKKLLFDHVIGFVHVGQSVHLKIAAFDFTRYGTIPGTITGISHDVEGAIPLDAPNPAETNPVQQPGGGSSSSPQAQQDAQAGSYIAEIALGRTTIQTERGVVPLTPGMQLSADIKTGRRRLISYLLSPLDMIKQNAMRQ